MQGLLAEISRKKKANEDLRNKLKASAPETSSKNESGGDAAPPPNIFSKFIRNGDRKRALEEEHMDQQRSHNEEREKKNLAMQQQFEEQARKKEKKENKNKQETDVPTTSVSVEDNNESIDEESSKYKYHICLSLNQLKTRLRAVGQPVTLFGEGIEKETRVRRLLQAQRRLSSSSKGEEEDDEARVKLSKHDEEEAELEADDLEEAQVDKPPTAGDTKTGNESDSDKEGEDERRAEKPLDNHASCIKFSDIPNLPKEKIVYKYFRFLVKQWELVMEHREDKEKLSMKGKMETRTQKQCKDYIRPLFKLCKKKEVPYDILFKLVEMVQFCEHGDFRSANDKYISTAIGTAPWPIGLTMVGIHERSGREKISTSKVAHMMNNELQRKYLTSVKRLMTFAQGKRPDVPPSMKVLN